MAFTRNPPKKKETTKTCPHGNANFCKKCSEGVPAPETYETRLSLARSFSGIEPIATVEKSPSLGSTPSTPQTSPKSPTTARTKPRSKSTPLTPAPEGQPERRTSIRWGAERPVVESAIQESGLTENAWVRRACRLVAEMEASSG